MRFLSRDAVVLLLVTACSATTDSSTGRATLPLEPTVRDSAGVTIYEHPADALARAPLITMDSMPLAVFAGDVDDPAQDVSTLVWPMLTASGDLVGFDRAERQLLVLHAATGERSRFGQRGSGPGDLGFVNDILVAPGDTLVLADLSNNRLAIAHPDTGVLREIPIAGFRNHRLVARNGEALLGSRLDLGVFGEFKDGPVNFPIQLAVWHPGDDSVRLAGTVDAGREIMEIRVGPNTRSAISFDLPFGPRTRIARWGDGFLVGRGEGWSIERWDSTGAVTTVLRINAEQPPVTDEMMARYVEGLVEADLRRDSTLSADSLRGRYAARPHADRRSPYISIRTAPDGTIWIRDYAIEGDTTWSATAIAPDGRILGRIVDRVGDPPIAWGDDRLAFKTEDDLGIATITIHHLQFP
jgi:hypothetical protein